MGNGVRLREQDVRRQLNTELAGRFAEPLAQRSRGDGDAFSAPRFEKLVASEARHRDTRRLRLAGERRHETSWPQGPHKSPPVLRRGQYRAPRFGKDRPVTKPHVSAFCRGNGVAARRLTGQQFGFEP